jgi:hypothetical protein
MKAPVKEKRRWSQIQQEFEFNQLHNRARKFLSEDMRKKVTMNLYRQQYGMPNDLMVREADVELRHAVKSSQALKATEKLYNTSLHPSLIFFDKNLPEYLIQKAVERLHGRKDKNALHKHQIAL